MKKVIVFGGSGFIGGNIIRCLVEQKYCVRVYTRNKEKAARLKLHGNLGQVDIIEGKLSDICSIEEHIAACDVVINLVGTICETKSAVMEYLHATFPENIAKLASKHGKRFIHFSAMGADTAESSVYARSKLKGETLVRKISKKFFIVRPNLVFGVEDSFFSKFASMARVFPVIPIFERGKNLLQPVCVSDVVSLVVDLILCKETGGVYEIHGPNVYSFKELIQYVLDVTARKRLILNIPTYIARKIAYLCELKIVSFILQPTTGSPDPLVTRDQLELMKYNIIPTKRGKYVKIGKTCIEEVVPQYLAMYKKLS